MPGIIETKEALEGVLEVAIAVAVVVKDGLQFGDIGDLYDALWKDPIVKAKLELAFKGMGAIDEEIKDIDLVEGGELAVTFISYMPRLLEAIKREPNS